MSESCKIETKRRKISSKNDLAFYKEAAWLATNTVSWGECKTDSRYADKWPKSLKELEESGKKVFIPFPKPSRDMAKCKRWLVACSREFFTEKNITRNTYICALHWPGEKGPTAEFPYPLKANLRPAQVNRAHAPKRKAPKERENPASKKQKLFSDNYEEQLFNITILQFLMIMIRSHKKLNRQSTKAVLLMKNVP